MLDITVKDFQSIEEASFTVEGFTALVGRSNIGKSALVRAVHSALTNALGTDFVRHGPHCSRRLRGTKKCRCQCSVRLQTENLDLLWEKGDEVNQYTYNGQVYNKVDRGLPDFLTKDFSLVKVGDRKLLIQVAEQFEPIFLLGQTGNVVADVLSDVAKLDDINTAISLSEKDRREANSVLKVREKDIVTLHGDLLQYEGLDDSTERAKRIGEIFQGIQIQTQEVEQLDRLYSRLQELATSIRGLRQVEVINLPELDPVEISGKALFSLLSFEQGYLEKSSTVTQLTPVEAVQPPEDDWLTRDTNALWQIDGWLNRIDDFKEYLRRWRAVDEVQTPSEDPAQTTQILLQLSSYAEQHSVLTTTVGKLEMSLEEVIASERTVVAEWSDLGICPTCSQSVRGGHEICLE